MSSQTEKPEDLPPSQQKLTSPLRVGFDLDGVLLYNPLRVTRPFIVSLKRVLKRDTQRFVIPRGPVVQTIWKAAHYLSLFTPAGFEQIKALQQSGLIEPYLVTARYSFLNGEVERFVAKHDLTTYFKEIIMNKHDEQPHLYKERILKDRGIECFIEDNWNIVQHLHQVLPDIRVLWMYNIFDLTIPYPYKFAHFSQAIQNVKELAEKKEHELDWN